MPRRLAGMLVVLQALPRQRRLPFLPREEVLELRDRRLRELVAYAAAHVPYYRDLDPGEIGTAEDLARLPLLDKATVQRDPEQFRAGTPLARDALRSARRGRPDTGHMRRR